MKVSVIIPVYNQGKYLPEAVNSVLAQTYPASEIIIVDDGSTDETEIVGRSFGARIHYIRQENHGPAAARNTGLRAATGEAIALLDADDMWQPEKLECQIEVLRRYPDVGVVHTTFFRIDERGRYLYMVHDPAEMPDPALPAMLFRNYVCGASILVRRECLNRVGLQNEKIRYAAEDWEWSLRMASAGYKFHCVDKPLYCYRLHGGELSQDPRNAHAVTLDWLTQLFDQPWLPVEMRSHRDEAIRRAHRRAALDHYWKGFPAQAKCHLQQAISCACGVEWIGDLAWEFVPKRIYGRSISISEAENALECISEVIQDCTFAHKTERQRALRVLSAYSHLILARIASPSHPPQALLHLALATWRQPRIWLNRHIRERIRRRWTTE